jgi:hypothetical protein
VRAIEVLRLEHDYWCMIVEKVVYLETVESAKLLFDIVVRGCVRPMFPLRMLMEVEVQQRRVPLRTHSMMSVLSE